MHFLLRFQIFLQLIFVITIADDTTAPTSLITDESCANNAGKWTIWTYVYNSNRTSTDNAEETFMNFYDIAEKTCFPPIIFQIVQNLQDKSTDSSTDVSFYESVLAYYASLLSNVDFRFRYCCPTDDQGDDDYDYYDYYDSYDYGATETVDLSMEATTDESATFRWDYEGTDIYETESPSTSAPLLTAVDGAVCGKQKIAPSPGLSSKIFGGSEAVPHSWPWMIRYSQKTNQCGGAPAPCYTACGGTLISNNFVITAAHCISTANPSDIRLIAGMHQQSSQDEWDTRQTRTVSSIYVHPQFNSNQLSNDIALLRVDSPFNYTTYVQPACLTNENPETDERVIIVGWGSETVDTGMVHTLKQAYTKVVGNCWRYWGVWVSDKQICVANTQNGNSACKGDSGGPIMTMVNGQYVASGVASFTHSCVTTGYGEAPNVFTRISSYRTWINEILNQKK